MTNDSSWEAWEKMQRRMAEDEKLLREFARHNSAEDVAEARKFVEHVRADIGPDGVITEVTVRRWPDGHEVAAGYYMEGPDALPQTTSTQSSPASPPTQTCTPASAGASVDTCAPASAGVSVDTCAAVPLASSDADEFPALAPISQAAPSVDPVAYPATPTGWTTSGVADYELDDVWND